MQPPENQIGSEEAKNDCGDFEKRPQSFFKITAVVSENHALLFHFLAAITA